MQISNRHEEHLNPLWMVPVGGVELRQEKNMIGGFAHRARPELRGSQRRTVEHERVCGAIEHRLGFQSSNIRSVPEFRLCVARNELKRLRHGQESTSLFIVGEVLNGVATHRRVNVEGEIVVDEDIVEPRTMLPVSDVQSVGFFDSQETLANAQGIVFVSSEILPRQMRLMDRMSDG